MQVSVSWTGIELLSESKQPRWSLVLLQGILLDKLRLAEMYQRNLLPEVFANVRPTPSAARFDVWLEGDERADRAFGRANPKDQRQNRREQSKTRDREGKMPRRKSGGKNCFAERGKWAHTLSLPLSLHSKTQFRGLTQNDDSMIALSWN